jgi:hypothetical protein
MKLVNEDNASIQNIWIEEYNNNNRSNSNKDIKDGSNSNNEPWIAVEFSSLISAIEV